MIQVRLAALAVTMLLAAPASRAADLRVTIAEYGLYTVDITSEKLAPDGIMETTIANLCHFATTTTVPLRTGISFGFRYRVDGPVTDEVVMLTKLVEFPRTVKPPGGVNPLSGIRRPMPSRVGKLVYAGYGLDVDWELMRGRWGFSIYQADRKLAEMNFIVAEDADAPASSAKDSTCFKLSSL